MHRVPFPKRKRNRDEAFMVTCQAVNFTAVRLVHYRVREGENKSLRKMEAAAGRYRLIYEAVGV
jgi:hypothetical protein